MVTQPNSRLDKTRTVRPTQMRVTLHTRIISSTLCPLAGHALRTRTATRKQMSVFAAAHLRASTSHLIPTATVYLTPTSLSVNTLHHH